MEERAIKKGDFFRPLVLNAPPSANDYKQARFFVQAADSFARLTNQCVYIIDYYRQGFLYVSNHPLFLCGKHPETVLKLGYLFYLQNVPPPDLELLLKINAAGFAFFQQIPAPERTTYSISYDFHLLQPANRQTLINHRLTPLALDAASNIWLALCAVSLSSNHTAGNVIITKKGADDCFRYDVPAEKWTVQKQVRLTKQEKVILAHSMQGYTLQEIAARLRVELVTVKFHRKNILQKLRVHNMAEAVAYAANHTIG